MDITIQYPNDSNIEFDNNAIVSECREISETTSRCIVIVNQSGDIIKSSSDFDIIEISASLPSGYIKTNIIELPSEIQIGKAYPNPFNPSVKIDYSKI